MKPRMRFARPLTPAPTAVTARDKVIEAIRAAKACPRHAPHTMSRTVLGGQWADACRACAGALIDALRALPADDRVALAEWLGVRAAAEYAFNGTQQPWVRMDQPLAYFRNRDEPHIPMRHVLVADDAKVA